MSTVRSGGCFFYAAARENHNGDIVSVHSLQGLLACVHTFMLVFVCGNRETTVHLLHSGIYQTLDNNQRLEKERILDKQGYKGRLKTVGKVLYHFFLIIIIFCQHMHTFPLSVSFSFGILLCFGEMELELIGDNTYFISSWEFRDVIYPRRFDGRLI